VIRVARTGPATPIRAKNTRNATAVHRTARPSTDSTTWDDGILEGQFTAASGA
jgi:hypothetical protein